MGLKPAGASVLLGVGSLSADDTKKGATDTAFKIRNEDGKLLSLAAKDWNKLPRQQVQLKESAGS